MAPLSILWVDQFADIPTSLRTELTNQGVELICKALDTLHDAEIIQASAIVVRIKSTISLVMDIQKRQSQMNSSAPLVVRVDRNDFELAVDAMRQGVATVVPSEQKDVADWIQSLQLINAETPTIRPTFIFADPVSRNLLALTERVAKVDVTVLLTGPTGSGKEVLAKILHESSPRHDGPFIAFNCAAMPENLVEDMLFGHEKGSFTGATKEQPGLFEQAQGGTIFLDEIGEMSFHLQVKLLRILQERNVTRLGGQTPIDLDIRVVAATNRNLKTAILDRSFREDLYFRLSAFKITLPALRERPLDILPLAEQFIYQHPVKGPRITLSETAQKSLVDYHWPGNVRELQNVMMRALVVTQQNSIEACHLIFDDITDVEDQNSDRTGGTTLYRPSEHFGQINEETSKHSQPLSKVIKNREYQTIMSALNNSHSRDQAAEALGISPRTLRHKLQRLREEGMSVTRAYAR